MSKVVLQVRATNGASKEQTVTTATVIGSLRQKLAAVTGFDPSTMQFKIDGTPVDDDAKTIGDFARGEIAVLDVSGKSEFDFEEAAAVPKMEIPDEVYDKAKGTVRQWKRERGIPVKGEVVDTWPDGWDVGARCEAAIPKVGHHRGAISWRGRLPRQPGLWVGVTLDEPMGDTDGTYDGNRLFECEEKHGVFVRKLAVKVGDYPVIDWEAELKDEM